MIRHKKSAKLWLRVLALAMAMLLLCGGSVMAADMDDVPYASYCYWEGPSRNVAVPMRAMFEATTQITIDSLGIFDMWVDANSKEPQGNDFNIGSDEAVLNLKPDHITLSSDGKELYVLDSPNSRILVVDTATYELTRVINEVPLVGNEYGIAAYQDITLEANTDYTVTWYTHRAEGKNAYCINLMNGETALEVTGENVFDHAYDAMQEWVEHVITFNTGDATDVRFQIEGLSTTYGVFDIDEITLVKTDDESNTNLLPNGDFEAGVEGWNTNLGATESEYRYNQTKKALRLANGLDYKDAKGVFVAEDGRVFVCDTEHRRILIMNKDGELEKILEKPDPKEHPELPEDLEYQVQRVLIDHKGYLYVVDSTSLSGMLVYDTDYNFKGFHGAYKASATVLENLKGWITGLFMTNAKSESSTKKYGTAILDVAIDSKGMLYTLSDPKSNTGQIKRLGLNGTQTLNFKSGFTTQNGDLLTFIEQPKNYYKDDQNYPVQCNLAALAVDSQGFIYAADTLRSRLYVFDEECRMLCAFSLGYNQGNQVGTFNKISSIAVSDDKLFVTDINNGSITVFELTQYGALYKEADTLTINGEYEEAKPLWEQIVKLDANNQRAYEGLAKAYLARKDYQNAMKYAKLGRDQQTYSLAFTEVQKVWLSNNFWWLFIVCIAAVGAVAAILVISKKRKIFEIKNNNLRTALSVPFHPFQAFQAIKTQKYVSVGLACLFVVIFYLARVSQDLYGGFMYVIVDKANYNSLFTLLGSVGLLMLWVITNWGICMLNDGKGSLKEVFAISAYSMAPMIAYSLIFTVGSHIIPASATNSFGIINTILLIYMALLMLIGMTVIHEYSFFKAIGMAIVTILCMVLVVFVLCVVVLLSQQFILFFVGLYNEIRVR